VAQRPVDVYLNDHFAGATFGADLARQLEDQAEGTDFHPEMTRLAAEIEADLDTLTDLMQRIGCTRDPSKQIAAWVAEKASRIKLTGLTSSSDELGTFLSIDALSLGVEGKSALWVTLRELHDDYPELQSTDLDDLFQRAQRQRQILETERIAAAQRALATEARHLSKGKQINMQDETENNETSDSAAPEDQPGEPGAEGGSSSDAKDKLPGAPADDDSEVGDTDQHSSA